MSAPDVTMTHSNGYEASIAGLQATDWDFHDATTDGLTHGIHPYPAKFIPQIPRQLIRRLSQPGETVADIFCGSGTTLVEAIALGRSAVGVDANPLACLMSRAKTSHLEVPGASQLSELARWAEVTSAEIRAASGDGLFSEHFTSDAWRPEDDTLEFWFSPHVIEELAESLEHCRSLNDATAKELALTAFSSIVVAVSKQDSDTRYVRRTKQIQPGGTLERFSRAIAKARNGSLELAEASHKDCTVSVIEANILDLPNLGLVDLVVSSPPYPNAYSYHLYHRTRMMWLGMDQASFKEQEIGSHRKYSAKGPSAASIDTFASEMRQVFVQLSNYLKPGGYACFVVGDSTIRGQRFDNAEVLRNAAAGAGFVEKARIQRSLQRTRKAFNPAYGKIKTEDILVLELDQ